MSKLVRLLEGTTKYQVGDKVRITRSMSDLRKGDQGEVISIDYDGTAYNEPSEYTAQFGRLRHCFSDKTPTVARALPPVVGF